MIRENYDARPDHFQGGQKIRQPENRIISRGERENDVAFRLPLPARLKLQALRTKAEAAQTHIRFLTGKQQKLQETKRAIEEEISCLLTPRNRTAPDGRDGRGCSEGDAAVQDARSQLADAAVDLKKIIGEINLAKSVEGGGVVGACERYIARFRPDLFCVVSLPAIDVKGGAENLSERLEEIRRRRRALIARLEQARAAPIPSAEAKRAVRAQIAALVERGAPDISRAITSERGAVVWPQSEPISIALDRAIAPLPPSFDALACFAWLHEKTIIVALEKEIDAYANDKAALSDEQRGKLVQAIEGDILSAEYDEESLVTRAEDEGVKISRRADADPRAILGLAPDMPAPVRLFGIGG